MLRYLHLTNVGPAPEMEAELAPRINLITGDNGLGKSFLLDIAWWALTRRGPDGAFLGILGLAGFVLAAVLGYTAVRLRGAALRLRAVATTAGDDVSHLTAALEGLGAAFEVDHREAPQPRGQRALPEV